MDWALIAAAGGHVILACICVWMVRRFGDVVGQRDYWRRWAGHCEQWARRVEAKRRAEESPIRDLGGWEAVIEEYIEIKSEHGSGYRVRWWKDGEVIKQWRRAEEAEALERAHEQANRLGVCLLDSRGSKAGTVYYPDRVWRGGHGQ